MSFDWGGMAGGVQDALEQLLQKRILEEKMALAQRQQAAEEQHRAALLAEQQAGRRQQGDQFTQRLGLDTRTFEEAEKPRTLAGVRRDDALTRQTEQTTAQQATAENERLAADAEVSKDPVLGRVLKAGKAGVKTAPTNVLDPEDKTGHEQRMELARQYGRNAVNAANAGGGSDPMTQGQESNLIQSAAVRYQAATKEYRTVRSAVSKMKSGLAQLDRLGTNEPASEAILVTFQKTLDPDSVVRESEYLRMFAGQAALDRLYGAWQQFTEGGAGVRKERLKDYVAVAEELLRGQQQYARAERDRVKRVMDRYQIPNDLVLADDPDLEGEGAPGGKTLSRAKMLAKAQQLGMTEEQARADAEARGYTIVP